ncbi:hypothetical protein RRF57_006325 [Xylaria bambusicola]|uniref:Uncharacterized protein n=1 Tax=Xylaria bambusicola TaxID=326684 RepID=A0AAN7UE57_9PEZI
MALDERQREHPRVVSILHLSHVFTNIFQDWNIPKHLARFEWDHSLDGKTRVRVYAYDTEEANDDSYSATSESEPSKKFFFQATFQPVRWAPSFPLSFSWLKYVGIDASLVQPPLPDGSQNSSWGREELPGTSRWCKVLPGLSTKRATLGWMDMSQDDATHDGGGGGVKSGSGYDTEYDNFWPGLRRWNVAIKMQNTDINFGEGLYWDRPKSKLGL